MKRITIAFSLLLSGCSIIPSPGEPTKKFTLSSLKEPIKTTTSKHKLVVEMPIIYAPIDNQRVSVVPRENLIDYYANCEWSDRLETLLRDALVYSLQDAKSFAVVTRANEGIPIPDFLLKTNVRKFFIVQEPQPVAKVHYYAQLIRLSDHHMVAQESFETAIPLGEEKLDEISSAFNKANMQTIAKLLNWLENLPHKNVA